MKTKYGFDDNDDPPPPYPFDTIADNLNTEPENVDEKAKQVGIVELKLETPAKIEQSDTQRKADKNWVDDFLAGVGNAKRTLQGLNDQAIAAVLFEEANPPKIDTEIDPVFIADNDTDKLTDENKAFIKVLLDKANYKDILGDIEDKGNRQKIIQGNQSIPIPPQAQPKPATTPDLTPPISTGIKSVGDKNWDNYIKFLEIYRPDLLVDKPDIFDSAIPTAIKTEIDDIVSTEPWLRPKIN